MAPSDYFRKDRPARLDSPTGPVVTVLSTDPGTGRVLVHRHTQLEGRPCITFETTSARLHPY